MQNQEVLKRRQVVYVYALVAPLQEMSLPHGWEHGLQLVGTADVQAVVELDVDLERLRENDDRLMQAVLHHDQVIRDLFAEADVLPLRFGMGFRSLDDLLQHLQDNGAAYREKLQSVAQKAEFVIRCAPLPVDAAALPTEATGKDYFLAKKRQYQQQVDQQHQQQEELAQLRVAIAQLYPQIQTAEPRDGIERMYVLSDRHPSTPLDQHLQAWQALCPHWELTLEGGLPPYHFV